MATDRALTSVLRAYQAVHDPEQTNRILSTTTYLLSTLSNPLNITLLTSQFLIAPAVWNQKDGSRTWLRVMSIFSTAAITVRKHELEEPQNLQPGQRFTLKCDDWARAVVKGADERSPRWQHVLIIGGILLGMEGQNRQSLSRGLRTTLEGAMVTAANLALDQIRNTGVGSAGIVLALTHTFDLLSDSVKRELNYDTLGPVIYLSMIGVEGYQEAYFVSAVDMDVKQVAGNRFDWSPKSPSFLQLQRVASKPLVSAMGPLSKLAAYCMGNMANSRQIIVHLDDISSFAGILAKRWRQNKLSELDASEEAIFLTEETVKVTFPLLWQVMKASMFAIVNILRAIIARSLIDPVLIAGASATAIASKALHTLRSIYFISSRLGANTFSAYTFSYLTAIDILSHFPDKSKTFLMQIRPTQPGQISTHPLDRNLDLFFLNTCEHFTLVLNAQDNESLIVAAASAYLNPGAHKNLLEIFEAAHSAMLAVLAAPQNAAVTARIIPFYVETLFISFPANLSPRQFRFAFKNLLQITTPPAPLSASEPLLADTLVELLHHRAIHAPTLPLPVAMIIRSAADAQVNDAQTPLSEQAVLILAMLDALPFLQSRSLEEWLPLAADLLNLIADNGMRNVCTARFWEVLESGEMDVDRAAVCVAWWTTRGGRDMLLHGRRNVEIENGPFMSGGLGSREDASKL
jgi:hypothetical protein